MTCPTCDGSGTLRRDSKRVDCPNCDGAGWTPTRKPAPVSGHVGISLEEYERVCARVRELEGAAATIRCKALEDAAAAMCLWCRDGDDPPELDAVRPKTWWHLRCHVPTGCQSGMIWQLMREEEREKA